MQSQAATASPVVLTCPNCGQKNRVEPQRSDAHCGRCKQPIAVAATGAASATVDHPVTVTDDTFAREVEGAAGPVLVDFWAPWCGPCRAVAPVMDAIARERAGRLKVVKVNVDDNPRTSARFDVQAIPTMMVFRDGKVVDQVRGALPKAALDARLDRLG